MPNKNKQRLFLVKKCALCGSHSFKSAFLFFIQGKILKLKPNLNCNFFGIYAALCTSFDRNCVGQTKNSFSNRCTAHRAAWNKLKSKFNTEDTSDECALYRHYHYNHKNNL